MIDKRLEFVGLKDFYKNRKRMKKTYGELSLKNKWTFKYYVYANMFLSEYHKDMIWMYLNEPKTSEFYVFDYMLKEQSRKSRL